MFGHLYIGLTACISLQLRNLFDPN